MGCDIHMYVEKKVNDEWKPVKGPNPYYGKYDWEKEKTRYANWIYTGRNYDLFSLLADVRNDGNYKPISEPKGLPKDVSGTIKHESDKWGWDAHSHSYFTLKELKKSGIEKYKNEAYLQEFLDFTMKHLVKLSDGKDEQVRIVFWFDN